MLRLSILAAIAAAAAAFQGPMMSLRPGVSSVSMQAIDRRSVAAGIGAAVIALPTASKAASGDFPKQSYFGAAPISAPFGDTYGTAGAPIWEKLGETEKGIFTRIAQTTKDQLEQASELISLGSWEASRQRLRMTMYETRKSMVRLTDVDGSKDAKDLFATFKKKLEALDRALVAKDKALSIKLIGDVRASYNKWAATVGGV
uniref:Chloroplast PsbQ n=2 Tax=Chroomonas placoidea TaxID=173977 RepID=A0AAU8ML54_9CRYP